MILLLLLSCVQPPTLEPSVRDRLDRGLGILKLSEEEISQNLPLIHHYLLNHAQHSHRAMILLILKTHHEQARSASAFAELLFQTPCARDYLGTTQALAKVPGGLSVLLDYWEYGVPAALSECHLVFLFRHHPEFSTEFAVYPPTEARARLELYVDGMDCTYSSFDPNLETWANCVSYPPWEPPKYPLPAGWNPARYNLPEPAHPVCMP